MYERRMSCNFGIWWTILNVFFYMFQHDVVVQYTKQCFYWIPHPTKYVCRHQVMYPTLTGAGDSQSDDFLDQAYDGPFEMYMLHVATCYNGPIH